jgi:GxxExxY protein
VARCGGGSAVGFTQRRNDAKEVPLTENEIAKIVVDAAFKVHQALGPGLLESVYETVLAYELGARGLQVERQVPIGLEYEGMCFDVAFRADLLVEGVLIVELKSVEVVHPVLLRMVSKVVRVGGEIVRDGERLRLLQHFNKLCSFVTAGPCDYSK